LHLLSKTDLLPKKNVSQIVEWSGNPRALEDALQTQMEETKRIFSQSMMRAIGQLGLQFHLTPVSAKTNDGLIGVTPLLSGC
jgi:hypothetical protein